MRLNPKGWLLVVVLLLAAIAWHMDYQHASAPPDLRTVTGDQLEGIFPADFRFKPLNEQASGSFRFAQLNQSGAADWVLVNLWASWCPPCKKEMPDILALAARFPSLQVILLTVDREEQAAMDFLAPFRPLPDNVHLAIDRRGRESKEKLGVTKYPETFLLQPDRKIAAHYRGLLDYAALQQIERFLTVSRPY